MSAVEQIDVGALVPDGIEPVEAFRCWQWIGGKLCSIANDVAWTPGEALKAECTCGGGQTYSWNVVRGGMSLEDAQAIVSQYRRRAMMSYGSIAAYSKFYGWCPEPSTVALPPLYGFELVTSTHAAPEENCTCGIYAVSTEALLPSGAYIRGKVKLWGKIIPGTTGLRAEYGYPSELHVPPTLIDDPGLKAYGVPLVATDDSALQYVGLRTERSRLSGLRLAIAFNLAAGALNLSLVGLHVFR